MSLTRLSLVDFRSYADFKLAPGPRLVILIGDNGAGKTNLLEAVSLLAPGRGLRGAALVDMARTGGQGGFGVAARLAAPPSLRGAAGDEAIHRREAGLLRSARNDGLGEGQASTIDLGTGVLAAAPERRQVRIDGAPAAANALAQWLTVLWLTPAMDRLFTESAGGRRRFLDRLVLALDPAHAGRAARYEAAMRARNKLLGEERAADPQWLAALEAGMAEHGATLTAARAATVSALAERLPDAPAGPFARPLIALGGEGWDDPAQFAGRLRDSRARDAAAGRALVGPHRADLIVTHADKGEPAAMCSTGEQKALLIALVLAHAALVRDRADRPLILLLDEVAAHLDPGRRAALFERLSNSGGQAWLTGTERRLFEGIGEAATWLHVAHGSIA